MVGACLVQSNSGRWSRWSVELGVLRKPIVVDSRRRRWVPCSLDDAGNLLSLHGRRSWKLLLLGIVMLLQMLRLLRCDNSVGWILRDKAVRLTGVSCWRWRRVEQNEVLLRELGVVLVRGCCRQAGWTWGKPCWLLGIRGEDCKVWAVNGGGSRRRTRAWAGKHNTIVQIDLWRKSWGELRGENGVVSWKRNFDSWCRSRFTGGGFG